MQRGAIRTRRGAAPPGRALAGLAALGLAISGLAAAAASAQEAEPPAEAPTSLLPEIFEAPPAPPPDFIPGSPPVPASPATAPAPQAQATPGAVPAAPSARPAEAATGQPEKPEEPGGPTREARFAGLLSVATEGFPPGLFAGSDGRFLATLLIRLDGPLASRWGQILVQRALASQALPPPGIAAGDWLAARAQALVTMGAANDAHRMVMRVRRADYTPRLYGAAAHAALAAADPVGMCPIAESGRRVSDDNPAFVLADAWCAAVAGDPFSASQLLTEARRRKLADNLDIQLAQRIASLGGAGRDAGNPVWKEVNGLTAWRIGLADAAGIAIPEELVAESPAAMRAWMVRHARLPLAQRATLAPEAAAIGALGSAELRRILALEAADAPAGDMAKLAGGQLRGAMLASDPANVIGSVEALTARAPAGSASAYGYLIAASEAAARVRPAPDLAGKARLLVEAMVAGGHVSAARDWWPVAQEGNRDDRARIWAILAPLANDLPQDDDLLERLSRTTSPTRAALVSAGLHGLGRGVGAPPALLSNSWTQAMEQAVAGRRAGEVLVLAATGLQGPLADVPPDHFRRIIASLVAVGLEEEARAMVAEAAIRA